MRTLANHIILYDSECPMCQLYTGAFIKSKMLGGDGRVVYQQMPEQLCTLVDKQRAVNEIALVDTDTGQVSYGLQSLFKIIANSFPMLTSLFSFKPFVVAMSKLYAFISYNRRVIIPTGKRETFDTMPSFRLSYRIAYLLFTWWLASVILSAYAPLLTVAVPLGGPYREYIVCAAQMFFQAAVIHFWAREKTWDYLGNMMTISFAGSLLLLVMMFIGKIVAVHSVVYVLYFLMVAGFMLLEHIRRTKIMRIGWLMSVTWVLYRVIILSLILICN